MIGLLGLILLLAGCNNVNFTNVEVSKVVYNETHGDGNVQNPAITSENAAGLEQDGEQNVDPSAVTDGVIGAARTILN